MNRPRHALTGIGEEGSLLRTGRFPRSARLLTADDFKRALRRKAELSAEFLQSYVCGNNVGHPRLGIIVGRREVPHAVDRNRIKRFLREAFRCTQEGLGSVDIVFRLRRRVGRGQMEALRREMGALWRKLAS